MSPQYTTMLDTLRQRYVATHPRSRVAIEAAAAWMPGGNTRTVLHYDPFPLVITGGVGAHVTDLDGFEYLDCVGEFSAGLYGHSEPVIREALVEALAGGLTLGGPNIKEARLAEAICSRFPSVQRVRFCNSGTEANLLALVTARAVTNRDKVIVFDGAYHGGVMSFAGGGSPVNAPFAWTVLPYNDSQAVREFMEQRGSEVAAIIVEPILGASGNIPGTDEFLLTLRAEATRSGAVLIFDEVKTSRCGPGGVQGLRGTSPDLTTFGKYLGGGLPLGAFGGRADIMDRFDPRRPDALKHAGTFNNNVLSMAAGLAGLTSVYTAARAATFHQETEASKDEFILRLQETGMPIQVTGHGSMFSLHYGRGIPQRAADVTDGTHRLRRLVHLHCIESGLLLTGRGDIFLNLAMQKEDRERLSLGLLAAIRSALPVLA